VLAIVVPGFVLLAKKVSVVDVASANAWPPTTSTYLDKWKLHYSPGVRNRRVISVMILSGSLVGHLSDNIKAVEQFYWDRDLLSWFIGLSVYRFIGFPAPVPE
jgi:hypothetical protein